MQIPKTIIELDIALKTNYNEILNEFNLAKENMSFVPYSDGRKTGEWNVFGLKSIWGHWSKISVEKFKTTKKIFDDYLPQAVNISFSCLGPNSDTGWHTGVSTKSGMYRLANKGVWDWNFDFEPETVDIPITRGPHYCYKMHLGLIIPTETEKLGLTTEHETFHWENGKTFIFKDYELHHAWNHTNEDRYVLFWDIPKDFYESALSSAG